MPSSLSETQIESNESFLAAEMAINGLPSEAENCVLRRPFPRYRFQSWVFWSLGATVWLETFRIGKQKERESAQTIGPNPPTHVRELVHF